ncbi:MAG TPA: hypothetical protein LFV90_04895 [Rickettsia endosymbiont of Columbicola hoogstraali]|nr:hypothetical protein [Rickettsia endosymbiont of Columbicola hoogstraali]
MTKLWDTEFKKTIDVEINYLFNQEAAKTTLLNEKDSLDKQDKKLKRSYLEKDLFAVSSEFTKSHANPFILSIEQIFKILKSNGFNCKVSYDKTNLIEINEKAIKNNKIANEDNIIYLAGWDKEESD